MKLKKLFLVAILALLSLTPGFAQSNEQQAQATLQLAQMMIQSAQTYGQITQVNYSMAQQTGDRNAMQLCQMEYQMHQAAYQGLSQVAQNPQKLLNPQHRDTVLKGIYEYRYRTAYRDMRPLQQIQGNLAQFIQQERYTASVSGINANTAAMTSAHNGRMNNMATNAAAHQGRMNDRQVQYAADNRNWANGQQTNYNSHTQFVHGINNEYRYVDPNSGQNYWVPMHMQNPSVVNSNGSVTELQPFHNY